MALSIMPRSPHVHCTWAEQAARRRVQVSAVQREFVQKLLTFPVFSKHLAAVREINNMLRRALDLREACPGDEPAATPIKVLACALKPSIPQALQPTCPPCGLHVQAPCCRKCHICQGSVC